jgi:hypothetical protein
MDPLMKYLASIDEISSLDGRTKEGRILHPPGQTGETRNQICKPHVYIMNSKSLGHQKIYEQAACVLLNGFVFIPILDMMRI